LGEGWVGGKFENTGLYGQALIIPLQ